MMKSFSVYYLNIMIICSLSCRSYVDAIIGSDVKTVTTNEFRFVVFVGRIGPSRQQSATEFVTNCLGVAVTQKYILTMEECVKKSRNTGVEVRIRAGSPRVDECTEYRGRAEPSFKKWSNFSQLPPTQDVALVKLTNRPFDLSVGRARVCSGWTPHFDLKPLTAVGFQSRAPQYQDELCEVEVDSSDKSELDDSACDFPYCYVLYYTKKESFLELFSRKVSFTFLDRGGPILYDRQLLVGLTLGDQPRSKDDNLHVKFSFLRVYVEANVDPGTLNEYSC